MKTRATLCGSELPGNYGFSWRIVVSLLQFLTNLLWVSPIFIPIIFMAGLWLCLFPVTPSAGFWFISERGHYWGSFEGALACCLAWIATIPASACLFRIHEIRLRQLARKDEREFFLVLRPFREDLLYREQKRVFYGIERQRKAEITTNLIEDVESWLSQCGATVLLQSPSYSNPITLTRSLVLRPPDARWITCFTFAADRAKAIVFLPELTQGIGEELNQMMAHDWLQKTIILMSSADSSTLERRRVRWGEFRDHAKRFGIDLPEYDRRGGVIVFSAESSATQFLAFGFDESCQHFRLPRDFFQKTYEERVRIVDMHQTSYRRPEDVFQQVLNSRPFKGAPIREIACAAATFEATG